MKKMLCVIVAGLSLCLVGLADQETTTRLQSLEAEMIATQNVFDEIGETLNQAEFQCDGDFESLQQVRAELMRRFYLARIKVLAERKKRAGQSPAR